MSSQLKVWSQLYSYPLFSSASPRRFKTLKEVRVETSPYENVTTLQHPHISSVVSDGVYVN